MFEVGKPAPVLARGLDGWHRLFAARVFGAPALSAEIVGPHTGTALRGAIEELEFRGDRLRVRGWCASLDGPLDVVEVRAVRVGELGSATMSPRPDIRLEVAGQPSVAVSGFEFEGGVPRRDDRPLRLEIVGLRNWKPAGVVNAQYLPQMFDRAEWPPTALSQRLLGY